MRLHKDYGVNPTISKCMVCGEDKNELLLLLGASFKGEAPMHMVTSVEPCEVCKKKYLTVGVLMAEATIEPVRGVSDKKEPVPTRAFAIIKDEAFKRMFDKEIPKHKICYLELGMLEKMGLLGAKLKGKSIEVEE